MPKQDYVPSQNSKKSPWATQLKTAIATDGPTIGLTLIEVTDTQTACDNIVSGVNEIEAAIAVKEAAVDAANVKIRTAEKKIRANIKRGKTHSAYTNSIGQHLGVVGDEQTVDVPNSAPELTGKKDPSGWRIEFNLKDYFDGINIYKSKGTGLTFVFLALDTSSPYIDTADIGVGASYYAFYMLNDHEVGLKSNVVVI